MTKAERNRRYRERQILGVQLVTVEVDQPTAEIMVARGLLSTNDVGNRDALAKALLRLATSDGTARISRMFGVSDK